MRLIVLLIVALAPTAALANFQCTVDRQCGGGACEPFDGGPFLIEDMGDLVRVSMGDTVWEGYLSATVEDGGEISIVLPPQGGMSGLISILPSGGFLFTAHAEGDGPVAITGTGTCLVEGD